MKLHHFISCDQFEMSHLYDLFELASTIYDDPSSVATALKGRIVATLFFEPSTRTRLSFESAILRLGGNVISAENASEMSSSIKGESLIDTILVVSGYADAIILRHPNDNSAIESASISPVPIINGGCGAGEHPTQAMLDLYSIYKRRQSLDNLSVLLSGDLRFGRTVHSLIRLLCKCENVSIYGLSCDALQLPPPYINHIFSHGSKYFPIKSFHDAPPDLSVIYQTRIQSERFTSEIDVREYCLNSKVMEYFSKQTMIMHPLPRNKELSSDLDQDPRSAYFEQARNGISIRMALLKGILSK